MRLKSTDGPVVSVHNGNQDEYINSSAKTLNTITTNITNLTSNLLSPSENIVNNLLSPSSDNDRAVDNTRVDTADTLQWCNPVELANNRANNRQLYNINNTLAASLQSGTRRGTTSSLCSESSPDDSLLDYEEAHQSCSSADTSPQDEDRAFDLSDSESLSEEGNLSHRSQLQRRGIANPNYPGFQHLAHTLDYIKAFSDTDDDLDAEGNNINNNNNDIDTEEYKIDSVNRLDSVENIQKVFYDKPVFNIPLECTDIGEKRNNCANFVPEVECYPTLSYAETCQIEYNIKECTSTSDIVGDFGKEVEQLVLLKGIEREIEEAVEKLSVSNDLEPSALKYNIEPNTEQPFNKAEIVCVDVFEAVAIKQQDNMATFASVKPQINESANLKADGLKAKLTDAFLSGTHDIVPETNNPNLETQEFDMKMNVDIKKFEMGRRDSNRQLEDRECEKMQVDAAVVPVKLDEVEKFCKEDKTKDDKEKDEDSVVPRKKEKMEINYVKKRRDSNQQIASLITIPRRELGGRNRDPLNRRSLPAAREKKKQSTELLGGFDVYNIETAMPKIDLDAIETHLRAAREEERRRRTDREEIRRRLAMGTEDDYYSNCDRPGRKPSLQARLQSGMNLQICFMNETVSDTESPNSDSECSITNQKPKNQISKSNIQKTNTPISATKVPVSPAPYSRPLSLPLNSQPQFLTPSSQPMTEADFFARQAQLQTEARMALAQAKEMAHMQMEIERQRQKKSPITEMVRCSLEKVGIPFPEERRRLSRQILTEMNVAQLQVIVNDLHSQIETLNENLVRFLMDRDDLHMEQDSMLVDIEDLTRYLGAKEQTVKEQKIVTPHMPPPSPAPSSPLAAINSMKPHLHRIAANLVKK